jgi:tetratricopeptide (TPR) repeat protein
MTSSLAAIALTLAAIAAPAAAQQAPAAATAPAANQPKPSPKATAAIVALQTAINANDTANIPAKLAAAQAVASTPADHYWIGRLQLNAAVKANDMGAAQQAVDAIASSNALPTQQVAEIYAQLGGQLFNDKQYAQSLTVLQKAERLDPTNADVQRGIGLAYYQSGQKAEAAAAFQRMIDASKTSGQKPTDDVYRLAIQAAVDAHSPQATAIARDWLAAYPSQESWRNALLVYRHADTGDVNAIDLMRLSSLTNAMEPGDYASYADKALDQGNYGEAKAAIDAGIAAGSLKASNPDVAKVLAAARGKVPTAAELAAAEKGAAIPNAFLRVGDRYYAAGDYAKAASLYREALAKGVDPNLANLRLGEALVRSGDKAGAAAAFNAVTGPLAELAKFWLVYAQTHA